ncbi:MAG: UDP-N-acetylmuramate dehydrogenase [Robiginitomaculum sp.]|nr:UDP-N-acetylmuramate dehydrogenase [Robiginitomaculum sp.]MDQ7077656.1 UDP-N-acetylmuramate dehydrogenase [Robiginitomaculum sp.]
MSVTAIARHLPEVRGKLLFDVPLAPYTWLRVGGAADVLFMPADEADLSLFLAACPKEIAVFPMGVASNLLVRDGGVRGVVVRLGPAFGKIAIEGNHIRAGAAALDKSVARASAKAGLAGLEFYAGIPGTIGGALRMNAGCYDAETKDRLREMVAIDRLGRLVVKNAKDIGFSYRHSDAPEDWIFVEALFEGTPDDRTKIQVRMDEITARREASQPIREKTGGSTFANPDGHKSWQLIDAVGGRGRQVGGAQMSEQHCNFMINTGHASAADFEALGEGIRDDVRKQSGIDLRWEIKRVGEPQ